MPWEQLDDSTCGVPEGSRHSITARAVSYEVTQEVRLIPAAFHTENAAGGQYTRLVILIIMHVKF